MRRPLAIFGLLLLLLLMPGLAVAQNYAIQSFDVDLNLKQDGTMSVTEKIQVVFSIPQHGIYRVIPYDLPNGKGGTRQIVISGISVTDESGRSLETKITKGGGEFNIRVGSADHLEDAGQPKTYIFRYDVYGMINWIDQDKDWEPSAELYWNVTGDRWESGIRQARVSVTFPTADSNRIRARIFMGAYGDSNSLVLNGIKTASDPAVGVNASLTTDHLTVETQRELAPYQGMTFALGLPAELIHKPTALQSAVLFLESNAGFLIPIPTLLVMALLFVLYGRDPSGGPMVVQFDPPDGLTASECGTMIDERVDQRDLAAGIITLAVGGYLTIHPKESGALFKHRTADLQLTGKPAGPELGPFEIKLLSLLRACDTVIDETELRTNVAPSAMDLKSALYQSLVNHNYYISSPATVKTLYILGGGAAMVALGLMAVKLDPFGNVGPAIVGGIIGFIIVILFAQGMPRRTATGAAARQKVVGLREFITRARGNELEWQTKKMPDQALFESLLPYAVAFGLTAEWAKAFEGINLASPTWYDNRGATGFYPIFFMNDLNTWSNTLTSAAMTPPRSSGASGGSSGFSSGGGFSGGGFGGGGGGSW